MKTIPFSVLMATTAAPATSLSPNVKTVQKIYDCFGNGDVHGILSKLDNDVVWIHPGDPAILPFAGKRKGLAAVTGFFQQVGQNLQFNVFQPSNFRQDGNTVSNDLHQEATIISKNATYSLDAVFNWTFNAEGKVTRWEYSGDVSSLEAAFRG